MEKNALNIYQRVNEVRKAVDKIVKDKKVESYMAVTHDNVTSLTREHFVEQGIVIVPRLLAERTVNTGTFTSRETPFIRYEATYAFDVVNADDPKDLFTAVIGAHAIDHGDKAPGKVLSYAKKSLVMKLLELESISEEENRQEQHKAKSAAKGVTAGLVEETPITSKQKNMILDLHTAVVDLLIEDNDFEAYNKIETAGLDNDEKIHLWSMLDSKQRSRLKEQGKKAK